MQRAGSRQRTPMEPSFSDIKPSAGAGLDGLGLEGHHAAKNGNGAANGATGLDFKLPAEDQIRFRGVQQEIPHFGAPPKRTESLYMKPGEAAQPQLKVSSLWMRFLDSFKLERDYTLILFSSEILMV